MNTGGGSLGVHHSFLLLVLHKHKVPAFLSFYVSHLSYFKSAHLVSEVRLIS